jgi:hypothetical protein
MDGTTIVVILGAALVFGIVSGFVGGFSSAFLGKPLDMRLTVSKPDDDRVIMTAEMTGWSEGKVESLAAVLIEKGFDISIQRLNDKEQSVGN